MKKTEGFEIRKLGEEYVILPVGERTETVNEIFTLSETAGFIYLHAEEVQNAEQMAALVAAEYETEPSVVEADVQEVLAVLYQKGILTDVSSKHEAQP